MSQEKKELKKFLKDNYIGEVAQSLNELVKERDWGLLPLNEVFTIREGVTQKEEVVYFAGVQKITGLDTGCGSQGRSLITNIRKVVWEPKHFKGHIKVCYNDLYNTFLQWKMNKGIKRQVLDKGDYINFLTDLIQDGIYKDFNRFVFFGNKNHTEVGSGNGTEKLTRGENPDDFNVLNGLFAEFEKLAINEPEKRFVIEENQKGSYAEQRLLAEDTAFRAFSYLIDNASAETFSEGAKPIILSTYSLVRNLSAYMRKEFKNELTLEKVEGGYLVGEFEGVKIVTHRWLDEVIKRDFDNGVKWDYPHRAILLDQLNEQIGVDSLNSLEDIEVEYVGGDDEHTHIKFGYMADYKRANESYGACAF